MAFCLANQVFLDIFNENNKFLFITGLFRNEVIEKSLSTFINNQKLPNFISASKFLKIKKTEKVGIKRYDFVYKYPAYFFNLEDLLTLLQNLLNQGKLSEKTLEFYLGHKKNLKKFLNGSSGKFKKSKNLGKLLNAKGLLKFAKISSNQLKKMMHLHVKDGPELKIMSVKKWTADINKILLN